MDGSRAGGPNTRGGNLSDRLSSVRVSRTCDEDGARVAIVNTQHLDRTEDDSYFGKNHWYFHGSAAKLLPDLLKGIIGPI
jgi:hypothetical protein